MLAFSQKAKGQLKAIGRRARNQRGQALIEFIMLVPIIMTFVWYLVHVNLAINKSLVGQKAARSQLFLKMYNHRSGPVLSEFGNTVRSSFYVGVAGKVISSGAVEAPIETMGIGPEPKPMALASNDPGEAPIGSMRQKIRIRTVFGICTHRKFLPDRTNLTDFCGSEPEQ
jgi:hypothetical protein